MCTVPDNLNINLYPSLEVTFQPKSHAKVYAMKKQRLRTATLTVNHVDSQHSSLKLYCMH